MLRAYKEKSRGSTSDAKQTGFWKFLISTFLLSNRMFRNGTFNVGNYVKKIVGESTSERGMKHLLAFNSTLS